MHKVVNLRYFITANILQMPKKNKLKSEGSGIADKASKPFFLDKDNNILIQVLAKPGARQNKIVEISPEGVHIQINAPATEGEANSELIKYITSVLKLRKNDVIFDKGFKSRSKTLKIIGNKLTVDELQKKLEEEILN